VVGLIMGLFRARWFPYVAIGLVAIVGGAYGYGHIKGFNEAELGFQKKIEIALTAQQARLIKQKDNERRIALGSLEKKYTIRKKVSEVVRPDVSCDLPPECVQWFDDTLRASSFYSF